MSSNRGSSLFKSLGCRSYGSEETVTIRLIAQRELRFDSAGFADNSEELAVSF